MSWLAGGPRICFVSAIFGHVGVSLSQISFHFPCLTERGSVFCGTHYSIRSDLLAWQCRGRNRNSWDSSCACVGLCVQPLRYVDSVCMLLSFPSHLRSGTFIAGDVISGLCTISCSFCWALHYCNRVVQGDGHN